MPHKFRVVSLALVALATLLGGGPVGVGNGAEGEGEAPDAAGIVQDFAAELRLRLETANNGDVIEVPEDVFGFRRGLSRTADSVTIRGAGPDRSTLSFKGQIAGTEGLRVTANDFTIEDLAIEDTAGEALKIRGGRNITIRGERTAWNGGPNPDDGAYGIYPVQTENTLREN